MLKLETVRFVAEAIILQKKDGRECPCHLLLYNTNYSSRLTCVLALVVAITVALSVASVLAFTITLALCADVVAEHCAEHEVLFRSEEVERSRYDHPYGIETFLPAEIQIEAVTANRLDYVADVLALQPSYGELLIFSVEGEKHHTAHTLLVFIDVVHQNLHVYG